MLRYSAYLQQLLLRRRHRLPLLLPPQQLRWQQRQQIPMQC
jgi:hypothetical protein